MNQSKITGTIILVLSVFITAGCEKEEQVKTISIYAELDTTDATIGDVISYRITGELPNNLHMSIPELEGNESFEIRQKLKLKEQTGFEFKLVFWDTGKFEIPSIPVEIAQSDCTITHIIETDPFFITVHSTFDKSAGKELRPVKSPVPVSPPFPIKKISLWLIFLSLFGFFIYLGNRRIQFVKRKRFIQNLIPPPNIEAIDNLELINKNCDEKEFYVELSYLLRKYVESSIYIKTLEMTTEEIDSNQSLIPLNKNLLKEWILLLKQADLIKYAKHFPEEDNRKNDFEWSKQFIKLSYDHWTKHQIGNS